MTVAESNRARTLPLIERVQRSAIEVDGCWEWQGATQNCGGTPMISYKGRTISVRTAILRDRGVTMANRCGTVSCGNPKCVKPEHTVAMSRRMLQQRSAKLIPADVKLRRDAKIAATLRQQRGKLTDEQIEEIRMSTGTEVALAKQYNVSGATIGNIRRGESHRNVAPSAFSQMVARL